MRLSSVLLVRPIALRFVWSSPATSWPHGLGRNRPAFVSVSPTTSVLNLRVAISAPQSGAMVGGGKPFGDSVFAGHAAAGAAAISASAVSVHPLDTVKSLLQASARCGDAPSPQILPWMYCSSLSQGLICFCVFCS